MRFVFNTKAVQELAEHAIKAPKHRNQGRGLLIAADDGTYLMSTGLPSLRDSKNDVKVVFARKHGETGVIDDTRDPWTYLIEGTWLKAILALTSEEFTITKRGNVFSFVGKPMNDEPPPPVPEAKRGLRADLSCGSCGQDWGNRDDELKEGDNCPDMECSSHRVRLGLEGGKKTQKKSQREKYNGYWLNRDDKGQWIVSTDRKGKNKKFDCPKLEQAKAWCDENPRVKKAFGGAKSKEELPKGWVSLGAIAAELKLDPRKARVILREFDQKGEHGWAWKAEDVERVKGILTKESKPSPKAGRARGASRAKRAMKEAAAKEDYAKDSRRQKPGTKDTAKKARDRKVKKAKRKSPVKKASVSKVDRAYHKDPGGRVNAAFKKGAK